MPGILPPIPFEVNKMYILPGFMLIATICSSLHVNFPVKKFNVEAVYVSYKNQYQFDF